MYPANPNSRFDWDYYLGPHLRLAGQLLSPYRLLRVEIDRGIAAFPPGVPLHFHAVGHLFFPSVADLEEAMAATAPALIEDQRKYFDGESVVQVSEVEQAITS